MIVATKVHLRMGPGVNQVGLSRGHIFAAVDASLKRLKLDHIDLYQIHGYDLETPIEETVRAWTTSSIAARCATSDFATCPPGWR